MKASRPYKDEIITKCKESLSKNNVSLVYNLQNVDGPENKCFSSQDTFLCYTLK